MKVAYASDLHVDVLYYSDPDYTKSMLDSISVNSENADVLILAGDLIEAKVALSSPESSYAPLATMFETFLSNAAASYSNVLYVLGNHEHYHGCIDKTLIKMREKYPQITFLENDSVTINDVNFFGATMWTRVSPADEWFVQQGMNDYRLITTVNANGYRKLRVRDTVGIHQNSAGLLESWLIAHRGQKNVVITHHAPTYEAIQEKYRQFSSINAAYYTSFDSLMFDLDVNVWVFGHTHAKNSFEIGNTTVISNPCGYAGVENVYEFKLDYFEV